MAKPVTVEFILSRHGVPESACNKKITDLHMQEIALKRCRRWKDLPVHLGMEKSDADDLDHKQISETEKIKGFLDKWEQAYGTDATYRVLMDALLKIKNRGDAEFICELLVPKKPELITGSDTLQEGAEVGARQRSSKSSSLDSDVGPSPLENEDPEQLSTKTNKMSLAASPFQLPSQANSSSKRKRNSMSIIFAGKGKTKLFTHLFHPKQVDKLLSDTTKWERGGKAMFITSISGIEKDKRKLNSLKWTNVNADLLVYCMPVSPSTRFHEQNPELIQMLTAEFKHIWSHAVVALTFSNIAWEYTQDYNEDNPEEQYRAYCHQYSARLRDELEVERVRPKIIFDYAAATDGELSDDQTIPVIPAGLEPNDTILPGVLLHGKCWIDVIFHEMCNKCKSDCREVLQTFRNAST